jgi:hypothetical protein
MSHVDVELKTNVSDISGYRDDGDQRDLRKVGILAQH